jgi:hypothetical protein
MLVAACGIIESTETFTVRVDSIELPRSVNGTEGFMVRFSGTIGPDGCSRVAEVVTQRTPDLLEVAFWGERHSGGECLQMPATLQHEEEVSPPYDLPFTVRVQQPDGSMLERTVVAD